MRLTDVNGLGPAKAAKLEAAGIGTVQALAELDLRRPVDVAISPEVLRRCKQEARRLLDRQGVGYRKAAYAGRPGPGMPSAPAAPAPTGAPRRGLLHRLFRRR